MTARTAGGGPSSSREKALRVAALAFAVLLAGCEPRITQDTGAAVTIALPAWGRSADAQLLADRACGQQGLRAQFRSADRRQFTFDCAPPRK